MDASKLYTLYCRTYFCNVIGVDDPTNDLVNAVHTEDDWVAVALASEDYQSNHDLKTKQEFVDRMEEMLAEPEETEEEPAAE